MKIIDLSHRLSERNPVFPGDNPIKLTKYRNMAEHGYVSHELQGGFHIGTHIDMPMHMIEDSRTCADFAPECFIGRGIVIDMRNNTLPCLDNVREGDIVLLHTGHSSKYGSADYYTSYPAISEDLAKAFVSKKIKIPGMDSPSPDYAPFNIHKILLSEGIFLIENMTNLAALENIGEFKVFALPLNIEAEASYVRPIAIIN